MRTIAAVTPPGWTPPKVWKPPPGSVVQGRDLVYKAGTAIAGFTLMMFLLPIILMCVIFAFVGATLWFTLPRQSASGGIPITGPGIVIRHAWMGTTPLFCGGNEDMTYEGLTVSLPGQTAITATGNCHLTLVDCNITASQGIVADGNSAIVLRRGSVTGTTGALTADGNAHIVVEGTRVDGATSAARPGSITGVP